jgi:hypothetical protein
MGAGASRGLTGTVAQGDVPRREPESHRGPEPSDRVRDRQDKQETQKTEEEDPATAAVTCAADEETGSRRALRQRHALLRGTSRIPVRRVRGCGSLRDAAKDERRMRRRRADVRART